MRSTLAKSHFWVWFQRNNHEFFQLHRRKKKEMNYWLNELSVHLRAYCKKLDYDIYYDTRKRAAHLAISAKGDGRYFTRAENLVAKAPVMQRWKIHALLPPRPADFMIEERFGHTGIDPCQLWFNFSGCNDAWGRAGIIVYSDLYNPEFTDKAFGVAVQHIILNILGERGATEDIGEIKLANLSEAEERSTLSQLTELPSFVDHSSSIFEIDEHGILRMK